MSFDPNIALPGEMQQGQGGAARPWAPAMQQQVPSLGAGQVRSIESEHGGRGPRHPAQPRHEESMEAGYLGVEEGPVRRVAQRQPGRRVEGQAVLGGQLHAGQRRRGEQAQAGLQEGRQGCESGRVEVEVHVEAGGS